MGNIGSTIEKQLEVVVPALQDMSATAKRYINLMIILFIIYIILFLLMFIMQVVILILTIRQSKKN